MIQDHLAHDPSEELKNALKDLSVPLMHHDPRDKASLTLTQIIPKECTHTRSYCSTAMLSNSVALCLHRNSVMHPHGVNKVNVAF